MFQAVSQCERRVQFAGEPVHGLQKEIPERQVLKLVWLRAGLRVDQLQLIAAALLETCAGLGAHTNPIEAPRSLNGSVCLHSYLEAASVQSINQLGVDLKKRFTPCANYETISRPGFCWPSPIDSCQIGRASCRER